MALIRKAIEEPLRWIATNAGQEGSIVVQKVKDAKGDEGYNAGTDKYENLVAAGVIDPVKVVRTALQNASSIASLLLTTEALVSEIPEEKKESPAAATAARGGMGGMYQYPWATRRAARAPLGPLRATAQGVESPTKMEPAWIRNPGRLFLSGQDQEQRDAEQGRPGSHSRRNIRARPGWIGCNQPFHDRHERRVSEQSASRDRGQPCVLHARPRAHQPR